MMNVIILTYNMQFTKKRKYVLGLSSFPNPSTTTIYSLEIHN